MSLDNLAIARVLAEIGDLLEIKSENPFKIRAYRNASETIAHTAERVADLTAAQRLAIPGIGKDLAAKISELVETGVIAYHKGLLEEFPPTILDLLHLQGVGPKTVAMLYRELGIGTLDDLGCRGTRGTPAQPQGHGRQEGGLHPQGARGARPVDWTPADGGVARNSRRAPCGAACARPRRGHLPRWQPPARL